MRDDLIDRLPADRVYKVLRGHEWRSLQQRQHTRGSADDERDGYVHLSSGAQVAGTLARHYATDPDLWLLALNPETLGERLRWELSRDGQPFPHLYGLLTLADCVLVATRAEPASVWIPADRPR